MYHILAKIMNPNCSFYHAQANEIYSQYNATTCTVPAPVMNFIWSHEASDIQVTYPLGRKRNREV